MYLRLHFASLYLRQGGGAGSDVQRSMVLVIEPLSSLVSNQVTRLKSMKVNPSAFPITPLTEDMLVLKIELYTTIWMVINHLEVLAETKC